MAGERKPKKCKVAGCPRLIVNGEQGAAKDNCAMHYRRILRGSPAVGPPKQESAVRSFQLKTWIEPEIVIRIESVTGGDSTSKWCRDALVKAVEKAEKKQAKQTK